MRSIDRLFKTWRPSKLAHLLGVDIRVVSNWKARGRVPVHQVLKIETATGIPRHELRPDIYPQERKWSKSKSS